MCWGFMISAAAMFMLLLWIATWPSGKCQVLEDGLNALALDCTLDLHEKVDPLQSQLTQANRGRGLGFAVGHTVVDMGFAVSALSQILSIGTIGLPILSYLVATRQQPDAGSLPTCAPGIGLLQGGRTLQEVRMLQATEATAVNRAVLGLRSEKEKTKPGSVCCYTVARLGSLGKAWTHR